MTYTPYDWKTGEKITEERLDYMENGIADASDEVFIVDVSVTNFDPESGNWAITSANKTAKEIYDAAMDNKVVIARVAYYRGSDNPLIRLFTIEEMRITQGIYYVNFISMKVQPHPSGTGLILTVQGVSVSSTESGEDVRYVFERGYTVALQS